VDPTLDQIDGAAKANWTLHVFITEGADMPRIQFAITMTRKRLRHRYDLRSEALQPQQDGLPPMSGTGLG
jgi:hypothetical protein